MTDSALPVVAKTNLPGQPRRATRGDVLRLEAYRAKLQTGVASLRAWADVATDPVLGLAAYRGAASIPVSIARRSLASMLRRCAPEELARSADDVVARVSVHAPKAIDALGKIANGDFEDADRARAQTGAARVVLEVAGLGRGVPPAAAVASEPMFSDGRGGSVTVREWSDRLKRRATSLPVGAPTIQVQAEVRSVPDTIGTHNPRGTP